MITVFVDKCGRSLDEHIKELLNKEALPTCLGCMMPPVVSRVAEFEVDDIVAIKEGCAPEEQALQKPQDILHFSSEREISKYVIKKSALNIIEDYKALHAKMYADQIIRCTSCKHVDVCDKLTNNYLRAIELRETLNKGFLNED